MTVQRRTLKEDPNTTALKALLQDEPRRISPTVRVVAVDPAVRRREVLRGILQIGVGLGTTLAGIGMALAGNGIGEMADVALGNVSPVVQLITAGFYAGGFTMVGLGAHTMYEAHKAHGQGQVKGSHGFVKGLVGAALISVPTLAGHEINTMFGNAANSSVNGTTTVNMN